MAIETWKDKPQGREKAGLAVAKIGGGGLAAMGVAGVLPFITLPMILIAMIVLGIGFAL